MDNQTTKVEYKPTPIEKARRFSFPTIFQIILAVVAVAVIAIGWFLFTAKSIRFTSNAESFSVEVVGGIVIPSGPSLLMREGFFVAMGSAEGYEDLVQEIEVSDASTQQIALKFVPLPGVVQFTSTPENVTISENGVELGQTPLEIELSEGLHRLVYSAPRYIDSYEEIDVRGKMVRQRLDVRLTPDWGDVILPTIPTNASVSIDGEMTLATTPGPIEVPSGEHVLSVKLPGYQRWSDIVFVTAGESMTLNEVELVQVGGTAYLSSDPVGASVTLAGEFLGITPFEIDLPSNERTTLSFLLAGHQPASRTITLDAGEARRTHVTLQPITGELSVKTQPTNATIYLNGAIVGESDQDFTLPVDDYEIEIVKEGFAGFKKQVTIQSDFTQQVKVRLLTFEEARLEALKQVRTTPDGQEIMLLQPSPILMGASRRQPSRRANETFRTANLSRLFYLGTREVTNQHFRQFASGHESGDHQGQTLDKEEQPVVNVSWREGVLYLNWLSTQEGLTPFYIIEKDRSVSVNKSSLGYRYPTEAEWAWAARTTNNEQELLLFPWGNSLPPPARHGNYADRSAQHVVGRIIYNYNDNFIASAPVGSFDPNDKGIYDLGGNVAEWIHNFYSIPATNSIVDELGPDDGEYHVIRGSSWKHGTRTDLRLSFRDYGKDGKEDLGFRVARYAE